MQIYTLILRSTCEMFHFQDAYKGIFYLQDSFGIYNCHCTFHARKTHTPETLFTP
jgi:hypothetical protein